MNKIVGSRSSVKATIKDISQKPGKQGPYLMWVFSAAGMDRAVGFTDAEIIPGNRTWTWLEMLGFSLSPGVEFNLDLLKGFECYIFADESGTIRMVKSLSDRSATQGDTGISSNPPCPSPAPKPSAEPSPAIEPPKEDPQTEAERLFS